MNRPHTRPDTQPDARVGTRPGEGLVGRLGQRWVVMRDDPERGDISYWVIMSVLVAFAVCMLLVDGSAKRQADTQAHWYAAEAARAGVNAAGPRYAMTGAGAGVPASGADSAATAARAYLARVGVTGAVTVTSPTQVRVSATVTRAGPMSGHAFTSTESATADLLVGIQNGMTP